MGHSPAPYVIVGMMACFGGISRAPLAVMLMVAEMTGSLSILTPAMVAVGISWLIVRRNDDTIYRSQLKSRADAPAQRILAGLPLLGAIPTTRAMVTPRLVLSSDTTDRKRARAALERRQPAMVLPSSTQPSVSPGLWHAQPSPRRTRTEER